MSAAGESKKFGAMGGKKRAANLSKTERSAQAKKAAAARWSGDLPVAEYDGILRIADTEITCAVLGDGTRVLTQAEVLQALGRHRRANTRFIDGDEHIPPVLQGESLKPFISKELLEKSKPIRFRMKRGGVASGYRAEVLPAICEVYLNARDAGSLNYQQQHVALQADILVRAFATVGIVALVDEATGFQRDRARDALAKVLEAFVQKELRKWVRVFPGEFYQELFRLRELEFPPANMQTPRYIGTLTNNIVYDRLAPGVKDELKRVTPRDAKGRPKHKLFQRLTENVGHPKLLEHLASVVALMKISPDYVTFERYLDVALPKWSDQLRLGETI